MFLDVLPVLVFIPFEPIGRVLHINSLGHSRNHLPVSLQALRSSWVQTAWALPCLLRSLSPVSRLRDAVSDPREQREVMALRPPVILTTKNGMEFAGFVALQRVTNLL
jgi:hypothetical protein